MSQCVLAFFIPFSDRDTSVSEYSYIDKAFLAATTYCIEPLDLWIAEVYNRYYYWEVLQDKASLLRKVNIKINKMHICWQQKQ